MMEIILTDKEAKRLLKILQQQASFHKPWDDLIEKLIKMIEGYGT